MTDDRAKIEELQGKLEAELYAVLCERNALAAEIRRLNAENALLKAYARERNNEVEHLRSERANLIALLAKARGPEGETEERVAQWLRGRGYTCFLESKWQPIETVPDSIVGKFHDVLVYDPSQGIMIARCSNDDWWVGQGCQEPLLIEPTYWMLLPDEPRRALEPKP
jgi:hypothetical protein